MAAQDASEERRFSLSVLGFPLMAEDDAGDQLAGIFGIPKERALRYVREVPARVAEDLSMAELDLHVLMLHDLGAELRVVEETGPGSWTVPPPRDPGTPIDRAKLCRWHKPDPPLRRRRKRPARPPVPSPKQDSADAVSEAVPDTELGADATAAVEDEVAPEAAPDPGPASTEPRRDAAPPSKTKRPPKPPPVPRAPAGDDDEQPSKLEIEVFAPPELKGEHSVWVDRMATAEFFTRGIEERKSRREAEKRHERPKRKRVSFKAQEVAKRRRAFRDKVAKGTIVFSVVVGGFLLADALLPPGPKDLVHVSEVGRFTAELPRGFVNIESRTGIWESPLGDMPYSAHSSRNRDDDLGAMVFNVLDLPDFISDRFAVEDLLRSAMNAAIDAQGGRLVENRRIHLEGYDGLEGEYRVNRFGSTFVGRIWVFEVYGDLALLSCEGSGSACLHDPRAERFFESFSVEIED